VIAATGLRWILTVLFVLVAGYALLRAVRAAVWEDRVTHLLHAVMGVAMALMAWPWGARQPAAPQAVFFGLAAAWFVALAALPGPAAWRSAAHGGTVSRRWGHALPHAVMMGAMAWMLEAMPPMSHTRSPGSGTGSMDDMPGMSMGGSSGGMSMELHGASRTVAVVLLVLFVVLGLWWLARAFDAGRLPVTPGVTPAGAAVNDGATVHRALDAGCHGAMSLGMAVMLLVMV
jgi:hypothetical protein